MVSLSRDDARTIRLVAWNIRAGGGIRADGIAAQLLRWRADVAALSEFRGTAASQSLAERLSEGGLVHQQHTIDARRASENRLLIAARWPLELLRVERAPHRTGRWLATRVHAWRPFVAIGMHVPNRVTGRKWPFLEATLRTLRAWSDGPALMMGDTNTGRIRIDEAPNATGFIGREDAWMDDLDRLGWRDAYRHLHGERRSWTWYSPNAGNGYRLDQAFLNRGLLAGLRAARHVWGRVRSADRRDSLSDHAALIVDIDLSGAS